MSDAASHPLSIGQCTLLATIIEATAPKPGNVHRGADFEDVTYPDFLVSAVAIAPVMEAAAQSSLGKTVLAAVEATRAVVDTNTNLGTVLLLAPLAMVPRKTPLVSGVPQVLSGLTPQDAADVYQAIRTARPGGLGHADEGDIAGPPPDDLLAAMRLAADRDLVARQYAENFFHVLDVVVPELTASLLRGRSLLQSVVYVHLRLMSRFPDSLIARKCGQHIANESALRASAVLDAGEPGDETYGRRLADLDFWLRSDGHRRNPGTTADLIAAGLFAALRDDIIKAPFRAT